MCFDKLNGSKESEEGGGSLAEQIQTTLERGWRAREVHCTVHSECRGAEEVFGGTEGEGELVTWT